MTKQQHFSRAGIAIAALIITFGLIGGMQAQTQSVCINLAAATAVTAIPGRTGTFTGYPPDPCISSATSLSPAPRAGAAVLTRIADLNTRIRGGDFPTTRGAFQTANAGDFSD